MSWSNFACFSDKTYPQIVLQLFIEESHLGIGIRFCLFHAYFIKSPCPVTETGWNTKDLPSSALLVLLLLFFRHLLVNLDLRWSFRSFLVLWRPSPLRLSFNVPAMFSQKIADDQISNDLFDILNLIIF